MQTDPPEDMTARTASPGYCGKVSVTPMTLA
jgi:hypothetical protein